jgi:hypothetical protein
MQKFEAMILAPLCTTAMPLQLIRESRDQIIVRLDGDIGRVSFMDALQLSTPIAGKGSMTLIDQERTKTPFLWKPKYTYELSPLISNLQKAMRLRDVERCAATALQLLGQDASALLRRLAVVLLEDALLQPQLYAQVVWLMLAVGKGYVLSTEDVQLIIDAVATGLDAENRYDLSEEAVGLAPAEDTWLAGVPASGSYVVRAAYVAIRLRAGAGGMKFDTEFLERLAARILCRQLPFQAEMSSIDMADIPEFSVAEHMLPSAIDFHCYPVILESIRLQTGLKPPIIKEAMWWHRSSLNVRDGPTTLMAVESGQRFRTVNMWGAMASIASAFAAKQLELLGEKKVRVGKATTLDAWLGSKMEME